MRKAIIWVSAFMGALACSDGLRGSGQLLSDAGELLQDAAGADAHARTDANTAREDASTMPLARPTEVACDVRRVSTMVTPVSGGSSSRERYFARVPTALRSGEEIARVHWRHCWRDVRVFGSTSLRAR